MDELGPVESAEIVNHRMPQKNRRILAVVLLLAFAGFFGVKGGLFAPSVGTSLDDQLTRQFKDVAGENSSVTCPPSAKFYAGATILCEVETVAWDSLMPNLKYVQIVVDKNNLFRALPVNG